jgi:hypothetical protein
MDAYLRARQTGSQHPDRTPCHLTGAWVKRLQPSDIEGHLGIVPALALSGDRLLTGGQAPRGAWAVMRRRPLRLGQPGSRASVTPAGSDRTVWRLRRR